MDMDTQVNVKRMTLEAVVTRAKRNPDGSPVLDADGKPVPDRTENLGTIAYWHKNPLLRLWARIRGLGRIAAH